MGKIIITRLSRNEFHLAYDYRWCLDNLKKLKMFNYEGRTYRIVRMDCGDKSFSGQSCTAYALVLPKNRTH